MFITSFSEKDNWQRPKWVNGLSGWEWTIQEDSLATIEYSEEIQKSNANSRIIALAAIATLFLFGTGILSQHFSTLQRAGDISSAQLDQ